MKRVLGLVLVAGILVWGSLLLDFGQPPARKRQAEPVESAAAVAQPKADEAGAAPHAASPPQEAAAPARAEPVAHAAGKPSAAVASAPKPGQGTVAVIGKKGASAPKGSASGGPAYDDEPAPTTLMTEATGELGEGVLSPEFVEAEQHYSTEPRDGPWALEEEQRVRALLHGDALEKNVVMVHCQQTTCRMVLETDSPDVWKQLLAVPGLREETALSASSPYSLRSGQLAVYFRRQEATAQAQPH